MIGTCIQLVQATGEMILSKLAIVLDVDMIHMENIITKNEPQL